ncbi:MAG: hypothetical protein JST80_12670 [Bdellovibrionales bacterium]|nr:hypothetical protein [Bdellovibrionales bacterium]
MNDRDQHLNRNNETQAKQGQNGPLEEGVKIDGLQQVIELLKFADPAFRESLLKRLTARDPRLAASLRKIIR